MDSINVTVRAAPGLGVSMIRGTDLGGKKVYDIKVWPLRPVAGLHDKHGDQGENAEE